MFSMTGFGKGETLLSDGSVVSVQMSSVNRKQLEIRFALPNELTALEIPGRKIISEAVSRGAVQVRCTLTASNSAANANTVNTALLDNLIRECRAARVRANLDCNVAVETLLALPQVIEKVKLDGDSPEVTNAFISALKIALENFNSMRKNEGEALKNDLLARLDKLEKIHAFLSEASASYPESAKQRLLDKLAEEKLPVSPDDPALLREVVFYIDRGDVTEELTRLTSHFKQFREFINSENTSGRSMDFLAQELFREITTFGNKSAVPETAPMVVEFKTEMEKIREQIQNIE